MSVRWPQGFTTFEELQGIEEAKGFRLLPSLHSERGDSQSRMSSRNLCHWPCSRWGQGLGFRWPHSSSTPGRQWYSRCPWEVSQWKDLQERTQSQTRLFKQSLTSVSMLASKSLIMFMRLSLLCYLDKFQRSDWFPPATSMILSSVLEMHTSK